MGLSNGICFRQIETEAEDNWKIDRTRELIRSHTKYNNKDLTESPKVTLRSGEVYVPRVYLYV